jgi:hypothetical protein
MLSSWRRPSRTVAFEERLCLWGVVGARDGRPGAAAAAVVVAGVVQASLVVPPGLVVAVEEKLHHHDHVHKDIVARDDHLPRSLTCEHSAGEIAYIAQKPFGEKVDGESGGALEFVILVYLRELGKEPGCYAQAAEEGGYQGERGGDADVKGRGELPEEFALWGAVRWEMRVEVSEHGGGVCEAEGVGRGCGGRLIAAVVA